MNLAQRATLAAAMAVAFCGAALGQDEEFVERRDKKLASEFLKKAAWTTDYDKARAEAKKAGKPIFAYFSRSFSP